jgi:hypothetical protein
LNFGDDMSESWSSRDKKTLATLERLRGARAETLLNYPCLKPLPSGEAARKQLERLRDQGLLASSPLPRGSALFRLSRKGVALTGAPPAYASSPSTGIAAEMLAVSALAWRTDEFLFLTKSEMEALLAGLTSDPEPPKVSGRFVLRPVKTAGDNPPVSELRLHAFLAEMRPAEELVKRASVIVQNLKRGHIFAELIQARLLGLTIAVPSRGVKTSLTGKPFEIETSIVIVEELQDLMPA